MFKRFLFIFCLDKLKAKSLSVKNIKTHTKFTQTILHHKKY